MFGEYALKTVCIPLNSESIIEEYGAVNIIKGEKHIKCGIRVSGDGDECFTNCDELSLEEDKLMDDELYDFDNFE